MEEENIFYADIDADINHFEELNPSISNVNRKQYYSVETFNSINFSNTDLNILHLNIRSINTSIDELTTFLDDLKCKFDVICITESWLNDATAQLYHIYGYQTFHSLRPINKMGGGITVFVSDAYEVGVVREQTVCAEHIETLFLEVCNKRSGQILVLCTVYKPSGDGKLFVDSLCQYLLQVTNRRGVDVIVCGDFNVDLLTVGENALSFDFLNRMHGLSFIPVISKPTRVTNTSATLIDNIFISTPALYTSGIFATDISGHFPIFVKINDYFQHQANSVTENKVVKYRLINENTVSALKDRLCGIDWDTVINNNDSNIAFTELERLVYQAYNICCPITAKTICKKQLRKPWISREILSLIRRREAYAILYKSNKLPPVYYKAFRNFVTGKIRSSKRNYYQTKFDSLQKDVKKTWGVINSF